MSQRTLYCANPDCTGRQNAKGLRRRQSVVELAAGSGARRRAARHSRGPFVQWRKPRPLAQLPVHVQMWVYNEHGLSGQVGVRDLGARGCVRVVLFELIHSDHVTSLRDEHCEKWLSRYAQFIEETAAHGLVWMTLEEILA